MHEGFVNFWLLPRSDTYVEGAFHLLSTKSGNKRKASSFLTGLFRCAEEGANFGLQLLY